MSAPLSPPALGRAVAPAGTGATRAPEIAWRVAFAATAALPLVLIYSRAIGDGLLSLVAVLFLAVRLRTPTLAETRFGWARTPWTALALVFWAWQIVTSLHAGSAHAIVESLVLVRLFVFIAAMEFWVLATPAARRWFARALALTALWVLAECWQQILTGTNMFGDPRWVAGEVTGPFWAPRAGSTWQMLALPAFLPAIAWALEREGRRTRLFGVAGLVLLVATQVLITQRMPTLLLGLSLVVTGLMLPRFRRPLLVAVLGGAVALALAPLISPATWTRFVLEFTQQMEHFRATQYAQLFMRAGVMIAAHPWFGLGFDGFRAHCLEPQYLHNLSWISIPDPANANGCSIHPHNYYLQAATNAGLPGLALFAALGLAWLWRFGRGAVASPQRVALFAFLVTVLWPITSATSFYTLPNAGFAFVLIGWGLAEARAVSAQAPRAEST